jgi:hypothetical protein
MLERPASSTKITLDDIVQEAMKRCDGDAVKAAEYMCDYLIDNLYLLKDNPYMLKDLFFTMCKYTAYNKTQEAVRHTRSEMFRVYDYGSGPESVRHKAKLMAISLLNFPLANGVLLLDADRPMLIEQIDRYKKQADTSNRRAQWLSAILEFVPEGKRVRDVDILTEEKVQELYSGKNDV